MNKKKHTHSHAGTYIHMHTPLYRTASVGILVHLRTLLQSAKQNNTTKHREIQNTKKKTKERNEFKVCSNSTT